MEILKANYINTTTMIDVASGTDTVEYLFNNNTYLQYSSSGLNDDLTTASITISFSETLTVDRILLQRHNWKEFDIFYNGVTANAFVLTNPTTTSLFNANSATNLYLSVTPVDCTSVTFDVKKTITANAEKAIGRIVLSQKDITFDRLPNSGGYKPKIVPEQVVHDLADGGVKMHTIAKKYQASVKLKYVSESMTSSLKTLYDKFDSFVFVPFETGTSWDAMAPEVVWTGGFDFYEFADDVKSAGYDGSMSLKEV